MEVRIRSDDSVEIEGYVNAVERKSKTLHSRMGQFVERICKGAFARALERNDNVRILENHKVERDLGGTKDGNLTLNEDNIGLHARAILTDPLAVEKARSGDYIGWSFGFRDVNVDRQTENGIPLRNVRDLDLVEVSLLDRTKRPAYEGQLVCVRSDDDVLLLGEDMTEEVVIREEKKNEEAPKQPPVAPIDYTKYEQIIAEMKGA